MLIMAIGLQYVFIIFLYFFSCASSRRISDPFSDWVNVRTVLFNKLNAMKTCWSEEDRTILQVRERMQSVIPKKIPDNFTLVLDYIQKTIREVTVRSTEVPNKSATITKAALYDALGGYLKSVVLPIAKENYYAGNVGYDVTYNLYECYNHIKSYLGTDGSGWNTPFDMTKIPTKVVALKLTNGNPEEACDQLVMVDTTEVEKELENINAENTRMIPIPYLDDNINPHAMAVPVKKNTLCSLFSKESAFILPKLYTRTMRCLATEDFTVNDLVQFNNKLYKWIVQTVVPLIHVEKPWYPAFGGVMRIVETMNQRGLGTCAFKPKSSFRTKDFSYVSKLMKSSEKVCASSKVIKGLKYFFIILSILIGIKCILIAVNEVKNISLSRNGESNEEGTETTNYHCQMKYDAKHRSSTAVESDSSERNESYE